MLPVANRTEFVFNEASGHTRLDVFLAAQKNIGSREKAQALILAGSVSVNGRIITKAGTALKTACAVSVKKQKQYVSRGAFKLLKALDTFKISPAGKICVDIGSSTGGFTEVLLSKGAAHVYAIDSGTNQIDHKLRIDPRVTVFENTNARYLTSDIFSNTDEFNLFGFCAVDVSFISILKILPACMPLLSEDSICIALLKPQFEAQRKDIDKGGIVKKKEIHYALVSDLLKEIITLGLIPEQITYSPITGTKGNIEYLVLLKKRIYYFEENGAVSDKKITSVIDDAFLELKKP